MRSPLNKRLLRELKSEIGRYLVIFILMSFSIALVSGFLVADTSMLKSYNESFEKYNIEDGNFKVRKPLNTAARKAIESNGITVYEQFYSSAQSESGAEIRVYRDRKQVNKICLMAGRMPQQDNEIVVDRMFAANNGLKTGDTLKTDHGDYVISGLVSFSDYSALFADNSDMMFDASGFTVAVVTDDEFDRYDNFVYSYCFKYDEAPTDEAEERSRTEDLMKAINGEVRLQDFTPRYLNQAIMFTGTDMGSDRAMMEVLLCMIIAILGFVFAVTVSTTIKKEMTVIGTLLASGYTRRELIIHYMTLPVAVTLVAAIVGNILGYTYFEDVCAGLYYNSYSLPTYETVFSLGAMVKTTLIPFVMMLVINYVILSRKLKMPILSFLRRQSGRKNKRRALPLSSKIPFFTRYRLRVAMQNVPSYAVLLVGIFFANLLMFFGLDFPAILDHYEVEMQKNPLAPCITVLSMPDSLQRDDHKLDTSLELLDFVKKVQTDNETAEKISVYELKTLQTSSYKGEDVVIYGLPAHSRYVNLDTSDHQVYISKAFADKFLKGENDEVILKEKYESRYYSFTVDGVYDYLGGLCIFMNIDDLNKVFDLGQGTFAGYMSETPIEDIDESLIGGVIDYKALTRLSRQMSISFGGMMDLVVVFAAVVYVILIYIMLKMIIDSNAQSISMNKIMGYTNGEIGRLYIVTTTIVFVVMLLGSIPLEKAGLIYLFRNMMISKMAGWFPLEVYPDIIIKVIVIAMVSYLAVSIFELRRVRNVPMDQALKNVE